jgi:hypothetical protein
MTKQEKEGEGKKERKEVIIFFLFWIPSCE